jgi:hypothetical protein
MRWPVGQEPNHALMWLCQPHHDRLTQVHAKFCRKAHIMDGRARKGESTIRHPAGYAVTLFVFTWVYVGFGRVQLTKAARAGFYAAGVAACAVVGPAAVLLVLVWPALVLWRSARD